MNELKGKINNNAILEVTINEYYQTTQTLELLIIDLKTINFKMQIRRINKNKSGEFIRIKGMYFYLEDFK